MKAETRLVRVTGDGDRQQLKVLDVIEAAALRDDAPPAGPAWDPYPLVG